MKRGRYKNEWWSPPPCKRPIRSIHRFVFPRLPRQVHDDNDVNDDNEDSLS